MQWGTLTPPRWPQDDVRIPHGNTRYMPPVNANNALIDQREAFTMSGTFALGAATTAGQTFNLSIPTEQDGDFWCDQIYMVAWWASAPQPLGFRPFPSLLNIADARTGRSLTYPAGVPTEFLMTFVLFPEDAGFDPSSSPYPDNFRSTSTLPTPFCFARQGAIQLSLTTPLALAFAGGGAIIDIAFGGWKEYAHASA